MVAGLVLAVAVPGPPAQASAAPDRVRLDCPGRGHLVLVVSHPDPRTTVAVLRARDVGPHTRWTWNVSMQSAAGGSAAVGSLAADADGRWSTGPMRHEGRGEVTVDAEATNRHGRTCEGSYP
ncbi:hypothetical protein GCM10009606_03110 [Nocardioides aquiterrae]|uniref:Uncharacterized protein n=1 Tax=Nocardioides aquiterrae TaxID=203799 RepID=A0ABN1UAC7_9ACTN